MAVRAAGNLRRQQDRHGPHASEGINFSPPVNREVTSEDVAYAIERGANPNVANPYFQSYFAAVEGIPKATGGPVKGITTPEQAHDRLPPDRTEGASSSPTRWCCR